MDKQLAAIKTTRSKLVSTSRGLATLFLILFVLYCAAHVAVFLYMALLPNGFSYLGPSTLAGTLPFIIPSISGGFTIFLLWRIFREIGRNASPFTPLRVRQIRALGFLFWLRRFAASSSPPAQMLAPSMGMPICSSKAMRLRAIRFTLMQPAS